MNALILANLCLVPLAFLPGDPSGTMRIKIWLCGLLVATALMRGKLKCPRRIWPWVGLALIQLVSFARVLNPGEFILAVHSTLLFIGIIIVFENTSLNIETVATALLVPSFIVVFCGLVSVFFRWNLTHADDFLASTMGTRNALSSWLTLLVPWILMAATFGKKNRRIFALMLLVAALYLVFLYRARAAWLMLGFEAGALILALIFVRSDRLMASGRIFGAAVVIALLLATAIPNQLRWKSLQPYQESFRSLFLAKELHGRDFFLKAGLRLVAAHPLLGLGAGNLPVAFRSEVGTTGMDFSAVDTSSVPVLFNDPLQKVVESGLLAGIFFLVATFGAVLKRVPLMFRRSITGVKETQITPVVLIAISLMACCLDSLVDYPFEKLEMALIFIIGISAIEKTIRPSQTIGRVPRLLAAFLALSLTVPVVANAASFFLRRLNTNFVQNVAYRLWPWDSQWAPQYIRKMLSEDRIAEARAFAADQWHFWPNQRKTLLIEALLRKQVGPPTEALSAFSKYFTYQFERCPPTPYMFYNDWIHSPSFPKGLHPLSKAELGACNVELSLSEVDWERSASWIGVFQDEPLLLGRWGRRDDEIRPWVFHFKDNQLKPLLSVSEESKFTGWRFEKAWPVNDHQILFLLSKYPHPPSALWIYDSRTTKMQSVNLPHDLNMEGMCFDPRSKSLAWKNQNEQTGRIEESTSSQIPFRLIEVPMHSESNGRALPMHECAWDSNGTLWGIQADVNDPGLIRCNSTGSQDSLVCSLEVNLHLKEAGRVFLNKDGEAGVLGWAESQEWERPFSLSKTGQKILPIKRFDTQKGDVIDFNGVMGRISSSGNYFLADRERSILAEKDQVIYAWLKFSDKLMSIYSDPLTPRTIALLEKNRWLPVGWTSLVSAPPTVSHINISGTLDNHPFVYSALGFGDEESKKVVLWWHGGGESVSPRYYPIFDFLVKNGYFVLGVNMPGSFGYGRAFSQKINDSDSLRECVSATIQWINSRPRQEIISWSVSGGSRMQGALLNSGMQVTAIVDLSGGPNTQRIQLARQRGIPYFSIRGKFDPTRKNDEVADYEYPGNHFLDTFTLFAETMRHTMPFIRDAARRFQVVATSQH